MNVTAEMEYISMDEYKHPISNHVAVFQFWIYPGRKLASVCVPTEDTYNMNRLLGYKDWPCVGIGNVIEVVGLKPIFHEWNDLAVKVEYKQSNSSPRNPYTLWCWIKHPFWLIKYKIEWEWITWRIRVHNRMESR